MAQEQDLPSNPLNLEQKYLIKFATGEHIIVSQREFYLNMGDSLKDRVSKVIKNDACVGIEEVTPIKPGDSLTVEELSQEQLERIFHKRLKKVKTHLEQISGIALLGSDGGSLNFRNSESLTHLINLVQCIKEKSEKSENLLVNLFDVIDKLH